MPFIHGFSQLQIRTLTVLLATFIIGLGIKYWRDNQPLPEVDPELEKRFIAIADSLNSSESFQDSLKAPEITAGQNIKININTATLAELQTLPDVGPVLAQRMIEFRNKNGGFPSIDFLLKVKGIGKKTLENLSDLITLD